MTKTLKSKPKSAHDIGDPTLSSKKVIDETKSTKTHADDSDSSSSSRSSQSDEDKKKKKSNLEEIRSKMEKKAAEKATGKSNIDSKSQIKKPTLTDEEAKR